MFTDESATNPHNHNVVLHHPSHLAVDAASGGGGGRSGPISRYGRHHRGRHRHSRSLPTQLTPTPQPPPPSPPTPLPNCICEMCNFSHCCLLEPPKPPVRGSPVAPRPGSSGSGGGNPFFRGLPLPPQHKTMSTTMHRSLH
jgi:hypothetical protein